MLIALVVVFLVGHAPRATRNDPCTALGLTANDYAVLIQYRMLKIYAQVPEPSLSFVDKGILTSLDFIAVPTPHDSSWWKVLAYANGSFLKSPVYVAAPWSQKGLIHSRCSERSRNTKPTMTCKHSAEFPQLFGEPILNLSVTMSDGTRSRLLYVVTSLDYNRIVGKLFTPNDKECRVLPNWLKLHFWLTDRQTSIF